MGAPKPHQKAEARRLRRVHGMPMKQIAALLDVSPASVSVWTRAIELTAAQRDRNHRRGRPAAAAKWAAKHRARRLEWQEQGRERARSRDPLHLAGCMLYWAEGWKNRNALLFTNSDLHMARLFCRFLRESLGVSTEQITLSLNVYTRNGLSVQQIENHWLDGLQLPRSCLRGHTLNHHPTSSSGKRPNRLPYGVARLRIHSTRLVQHVHGAIQEYGGFDEPRWLDRPPPKPRRRIVS
jgi:DNA-binding transcriptional MerR regulator